jgi:hypothetical protein
MKPRDDATSADRNKPPAPQAPGPLPTPPRPRSEPLSFP